MSEYTNEQAGQGIDENVLMWSPAMKNKRTGTVIFFNAGPPDPPGPKPTEIRAANRLLRLGAAALQHEGSWDFERATRCYLQALELIVPTLGERSQKASYAYDRLAVV